jgi:hypothetical protein
MWMIYVFIMMMDTVMDRIIKLKIFICVKIMNIKILILFTPFYISNADFYKHKIFIKII